MTSFEKSNDLCRSHSARSDREMYRVCPSKLNKQELEDLYFTVLENNVELKKTINAQIEKIRFLSTKIQRTTLAQKSAQAKETKECCGASKAIINEQIQTINYFQKQNDKLTERVKVLNMQLCSAKQFLKRNPSLSSRTAIFRNTSSSPKSSQVVLKSVSCQNLDRDAAIMKSVETETETNQAKPILPTRTSCDENKCQTLMDELKQKIFGLEEELSQTNKEYSSRVTILQREVSDSREENLRMRSECVVSEQQSQMYRNRADQLADKLRTSEEQCADLKVKLAIEGRRVTELETRVKLADVSNKLNKSIEEQIAAMKERTNETIGTVTSLCNCHLSSPVEATTSMGNIPACTNHKDTRPATHYLETNGSTKLSRTTSKPEFEQSSLAHPEDIFNTDEIDDITTIPVRDIQVLKISPIISPKLSNGELNSIDVLKIDSSPDDKLSKSSDDSGYAESRKARKTPKDIEFLNTNEELLKKINCLQRDLDCLKTATMAVTQNTGKCEKKPDGSELSIPQQVKKRAQEVYSTADVRGSKSLSPAPKIFSTPRNSKELKKLQLPLTPDNDDADYQNVNNDNVDKNNAKSKNGVEFDSVECLKTQKSRDEKGTIDLRPDIVECLSTLDSPTNLVEEDETLKYGRNESKSSDKLKLGVKEMQEFSRNIGKTSSNPVILNDNFEVLPQAQIANKDEQCQPCDRCRYNQECKHDTNIVCDYKSQNHLQNAATKKKHDSHNSLQIPGPLPISSHSSQFKCQNNTRKGKKNKGCKSTESIKSTTNAPSNLETRSSKDSFKAKKEVPRQSKSADDEATLFTVYKSPAPATLTNMEMSPIDENPMATKISTEYPVVRREVKTYRRPSGTLCFNTTPGQPGSNADRKQSIGTSETQTELPLHSPRVSSTSDKGTYTVESKKSRATSPEGTDHEISSMTDLPYEKDAKTQYDRSLSPGECSRDQVTSTYTDTSTSTTDNFSLSEGECQFTPRNPVKNNRDVENKKDSTQKMEEALASIAQELTRCKRLLQQTRQDRKESTKQQYPESKPIGIELRSTSAQQNISDTLAPYCTFTLHIGTVVLSDEAVVYSTKKNLVLTWRFYDQNVAMSQMPGGRVMVFDCSTEYNIKVTEAFLHYIKHEDMPILICEIDKPSEPFAGCSLPLREALLHTNVRADMSLPLLAGQQLKHKRVCNAAGDEVGVLDLWCVLRDKGLALSLHRRNYDSQPTRLQQETSKLPDADLDLRPLSQTPMIDIHTHTSHPHSRQTHTWGSSTIHLPSCSTAGYSKNTVPTNDKNCFANKKINGDDDVERDYSSSRTLRNEVPTKIISSRGFKEVLKRGSVFNLEHNRGTNQNSSLRRTSFNTLDEGNIATSTKTSNMEGVSGKPDRSTENIKVSHLNRNWGKADSSKQFVTNNTNKLSRREMPQKDSPKHDMSDLSIDITVLWLSLREECKAMVDPNVQRVYVAYTFLGRSGADLETPISLPKPKNCVDKCYFNFKKTFYVEDSDLAPLGDMGRSHASSRSEPSVVFSVVSEPPEDPLGLECCHDVGFQLEDSVVFSVVSEPPEDPLGLECCHDVGYAYLYLGDVLDSSAGSTGYTEMIPMFCASGGNVVCGELAVRVDGVHVIQHCVGLYSRFGHIGHDKIDNQP